MTLNIPVFKTRVKTALIYAAVMLTGLLWNEWSFFILFSIVHFGCWHEFHKLSANIVSSTEQPSWLEKIHVPILGWGLMLMATAESIEVGGIYISEAGKWIVRFCLLLFPLLVLFNRGYSKQQLLKFTSGLAYISISLALLVNLRSGWIWGTSNQENSITTLLSGLNGFITTVLLVFAIWINDTMAYLIGSMIGKTPLTSWSPKKTWEGTVGGILVSVTLMFLVGKLTWGANWELLVILLATAIFGTIGDLVESKFKRMAGVKDSGNFMPGHGGFLDRFDSILLAAPAVWAVCYLMYR
jgi:phosphatidate cytidylyltransferase